MNSKLQAEQLLAAALDNLNQHKLSPVPDNYRLWYEYAAGNLDELNTTIDSLVHQNNNITEDICKKLYSKFLSKHDQQEVDEARIAISKMLTVMMGHLKEWDSSSSQFYDSMSQSVQDLEGEPTLQEVKDIVAAVTEQAKKAQESNFNLKATLNHLSNEVAGLREDVSRLGNDALTDALTETLNRRGFDIALTDTTKKAATTYSPCALIVIDVDDFKQVNDNFGHQVGDKILKFIASTLRKNIRGNDILARFGGEEFIIILPNTNHAAALIVAENLRKAVSSRQLTTGNNKQSIGMISISLGVTNYKPNESLEEFIDRADQCMYQAKREGKNRVNGKPA